MSVLIPALAGLILLASPRELQSQTLRGRVVENLSGEGIPEVGIMAIENGDLVGSSLTGPGGYFELRLARGGTLLLRVSRQGYRSATLDSLLVAEAGTLDIPDIILQIAPIVLDEVRTEVRRSRLTPGREWIRQRQLLGKGTFFSGALLKLANPPSLTQHVAEATNLWLAYDARGVPSLKNPFSMEACVVVMLNQWPINRTFEIDDFTEVVGWPSMDEIPLERIAAVEVYNEMRDLPPGLIFTDRGDVQKCGVVNIWTWDSY